MQSLSIRGYMEAIRRKRINGARIALNDKCSNVRRQQPFPTFTQSLEAALMDWADDITYAVHDLIDFFCAGQIPLERLGAPGGDTERDDFFKEVFERCPELKVRHSEFENAFETIAEMFVIGRRYLTTADQQRHLWRLSTVLISRFVDAIRLQPRDHASPVFIQAYALDEVRVLKELTWHYVILHHELATGRHGQDRIIEGLFNIFIDAALSTSRSKVFPMNVQAQLEEAPKTTPSVARIVADYIASMTDKEASHQFRVLHGL